LAGYQKIYHLLLIGGNETKQRMDKELSLSHINLERITEMRAFL